jgi:hypothetical protein
VQGISSISLPYANSLFTSCHIVSASLNFPERLKVFHFFHLREVLGSTGREREDRTVRCCTAYVNRPWQVLGGYNGSFLGALRRMKSSGLGP